MKSLFSFSLIVFLILKVFIFKVYAAEIESIQNIKQRKSIEKIAEKFCIAIADHFFEGLENEKTLKYSYFKYIGIQDKEIYTKDMLESLINQINEKCLISKEEERELNEFFLETYED